jgi:DNA-directed RNA polymerase subunit RPC12/RpoP
MLRELFARLRKTKRIVCTSCGSDITLFARQPTIDELLGGNVVFVFLCGRCGRILCERCLRRSNPNTKFPEDLRTQKLFLCPECKELSVEVAGFGVCTPQGG